MGQTNHLPPRILTRSFKYWDVAVTQDLILRGIGIGNIEAKFLVDWEQDAFYDQESDLSGQLEIWDSGSGEFEADLIGQLRQPDSVPDFNRYSGKTPALVVGSKTEPFSFPTGGSYSLNIYRGSLETLSIPAGNYLAAAIASMWESDVGNTWVRSRNGVLYVIGNRGYETTPGERLSIDGNAADILGITASEVNGSDDIKWEYLRCLPRRLIDAGGVDYTIGPEFFVPVGDSSFF